MGLKTYLPVIHGFITGSYTRARLSWRGHGSLVMKSNVPIFKGIFTIYWPFFNLVCFKLMLFGFWSNIPFDVEYLTWTLRTLQLKKSVFHWVRAIWRDILGKCLNTARWDWLSVTVLTPADAGPRYRGESLRVEEREARFLFQDKDTNVHMKGNKQEEQTREQKETKRRNLSTAPVCQSGFAISGLLSSLEQTKSGTYKQWMSLTGRCYRNSHHGTWTGLQLLKP